MDDAVFKVPFVVTWAALIVTAIYATLLRSRLRTAIGDIRYWRANADMWREKVEQLSEMQRQVPPAKPPVRRIVREAPPYRGS